MINLDGHYDHISRRYNGDKKEAGNNMRTVQDIKDEAYRECFERMEKIRREERIAIEQLQRSLEKEKEEAAKNKNKIIGIFICFIIGASISLIINKIVSNGLSISTDKILDLFVKISASILVVLLLIAIAAIGSIVKIVNNRKKKQKENNLNLHTNNAAVYNRIMMMQEALDWPKKHPVKLKIIRFINRVLEKIVYTFVYLMLLIRKPYFPDEDE